jgi:type I restriction enzyme M protein
LTESLLCSYGVQLSMSSPRRQPRTRSEARARYFIRQQAVKKGWDVRHPEAGGDFLEENEAGRYLPNLGLLRDKPDFIVLHSGEPVMVVEAKNDARLGEQALLEACEYADAINAAGHHRISIAAGVAGDEESGYVISASFRLKKGWVPLTSRGVALTAFPSRSEVELALGAADSTTTVTLPDQSEFIDAAVELSVILRNAKVEAPLRSRVIGAMVAAMYQGNIPAVESGVLDVVNRLMEQAIRGAKDLRQDKKDALVDALTLRGSDFNRLAPHIRRITTILSRLNVRAVLQTDTDFLGMFYEAFLRYGYDNNALGIVFTPRHITRYAADLVGVAPSDRVVDLASGTGGFLVAAFDKMIVAAESDEQRNQVKQAIHGCDTNPNIWALASLNMFFRGDGKSHMECASCLDEKVMAGHRRKFTRAFLNPPFSQENEPEKAFIDASMDALEPGGRLAAVVYAGVFADEEHEVWRREFLRRHTLLGMISLPEDIFYPTAAPTSLLIAKAHVPHGNACAFVARIWNDGYEKLKGRRVQRAGEQLSEVRKAFVSFLAGKEPGSGLCAAVRGDHLLDGSEWSPQNWLPQPLAEASHFDSAVEGVTRSVFQAVAHFPELADQVLGDFELRWSAAEESLPYGKTAPLNHFFEIVNGRSSGEKNYTEGPTAYISSGDATNSIVSLVAGSPDEVFADGGITVTAFGQAAMQPWPFLARGNGGSSVRVLLPKFRMSAREMAWFVAQINLQRWRFFYARMAIKSRLADDKFLVVAPRSRLEDSKSKLADRVCEFRDSLNLLSRL